MKKQVFSAEDFATLGYGPGFAVQMEAMRTANARIAPLMEALEALSSYPLGRSANQVEAVLAAYRELVASGDAPQEKP